MLLDMIIQRKIFSRPMVVSKFKSVPLSQKREILYSTYVRINIEVNALTFGVISFSDLEFFTHDTEKGGGMILGV